MNTWNVKEPPDCNGTHHLPDPENYKIGTEIDCDSCCEAFILKQTLFRERKVWKPLIQEY